MMRQGFVRNPIEDQKAWKLGATELPKDILNKEGDWEPYLPEFESQTAGGYETWACTVEGTENIKQILEKFHFGKTAEYDVRYHYNLMKIVPPGADPHDAAESIRLNGMVSGVYPIPPTFKEFSTPRPIPTDIMRLGIKHPYELRHQYLWSRPISKEDRTKLIREHLKYSPLGVSVTAWQKKGGVYVDGGRPNTHWTVLIGEEKGKGWRVWDSYEPRIKILSYDHNIEVCKRYQLAQSTRLEQLNIMAKTLKLLSELLASLFYDPHQNPNNLPMNTEPSEKLYQEAIKALGTDPTPKDEVSDEVACVHSLTTILKKVTDKIYVMSGTWTFWQYMETHPELFEKIEGPEKGAIIISPTGTVKSRIVGHTGICGLNGKIMSNTSKTGLWTENYTEETWRERWGKAGYPIYYFKLKQ